MKLNVLTFFSLLFISTSFSQTQEVLFTVNKTPVTSEEFVRVYNKNIDLVQDEKQKDVDEYLKLYVNYKLKLEEAMALGLDKDSKYLNELASYRKQLSKKYLTDSEVNQKLLEEAYARTETMVNVNHILVRVEENATPLDSIKAYKDLMAIREKAVANGFETTMEAVHNGKTVYGESLGYFNAFKMVYPFENASYTTPVGEISMPFRTKFGFHIINVLDKQKSKGEVTVAHIMIANNNENLTTTPKERIEQLHQKITEGADFANLARQFSDDKNSARNGGKLTRFGTGKLNAKNFEDAAFALAKEGDVSDPIKTKYGWHIIKLLKKHPVGSIDELKPALEQQIKNDSRSQIVNEKLYKRLKKRYNYKETPEAISIALKTVNGSFMRGEWTPTKGKDQEVMATFGTEKVAYIEYYRYLKSKLRAYQNIKELDKIVAKSFDSFINQRLYQYHDDNLEKEYPEFGYVVQEYREGLLLFELMEKEIWKKSKTDTIALKKFYEANKANYFWKDRVEAVIASSDKRCTARKVRKLFKNGSSIDVIKKQEENVLLSKGMFELDDKELPEKYAYKQGVSKIYKHNKQYVVIKAIDKKVPTQQMYEEVKGRIINDYQAQLEKEWLEQLKQKYQVSINKEVLKEIKQNL